MDAVNAEKTNPATMPTPASTTPLRKNILKMSPRRAPFTKLSNDQRACGNLPSVYSRFVGNPEVGQKRGSRKFGLTSHKRTSGPA
jgi:hypothetical protein